MRTTNAQPMSLEDFLGDGGSTDTTNNAGSNGALFHHNETTDLYYAVGNLRSKVGALAEAKGMDLTNDVDGEPAQVKYWAAIHAVKQDLGERQRDKNPFSLGDQDANGDTYVDVFGSTLPTIETEPLTASEKDSLEEAGIDTEGVDGHDCLLPVPTGHTRLPLVVTDESELEEAIEALKALDHENAEYARSTTDSGGSDADDGENDDNKVECEHCGDRYDKRGIHRHEEACDGKADDDTDDDGDTDDESSQGGSADEFDREEVMSVLNGDNDASTPEEAREFLRSL
jgi:hypothetical protein